MAFSFDDLREKVTDLAQSGVAKSKQLAEIAKLKTSNMGEEDTIKKAYLELGRLYYAERGAAPEGAYAAACGRISQAKAAIETNNARIAELKAQGCVEEEAESVTTEPVVEDVPPEEPAPEQEVPETPAEEAAAPEEAPAAPEEPKLSGPFPHRNGAGGGHCGRRRMTMKQYFRRPQDVVGEDRDLLTYWNTMSGKVQLRLLESGLSVSTLGELKMLQEQIEHEG